MRKLILSITLSLFACLSLAAQPTVHYQADQQRSGLTAETGPIFLETERWAVPMAGPVTGLVFDRGVIYAGAPGVLHAVNASNGVDFWAFSRPGQFSAVAVVGNVVYAGAGNTLYAITRGTGVELWSFDAGASISASAPLVIDNEVFIGNAAGTIFAVDAGTGALDWQRNIGSPVRYPLTKAKNILVAVTANGMTALRDDNGSPQWTLTLPGGAQFNAAASDGRQIYAGAQGNDFYSIKASNGHIDWVFNDADTPSSGWNAPILTSGVIVSANDTGWLYWLDPKTGAVVYRDDAAYQSPTGEDIGGTDGLVYIGEKSPFGQLTTFDIFDIPRRTVMSLRYIYGDADGVAVGYGAVYVHDTTNTLSAFSN
jgi:outer membrane protein assembly factor BamB